MTPPEALLLPLDAPERPVGCIRLSPSAAVLAGFARGQEAAIHAGMLAIAAEAPFRRMITPGGHQMRVAITNAGAAGWVTDSTGYRYDPIDPDSGQPWPELPAWFKALAGDAASVLGFEDFDPDACLINRYEPGARLSLHQDRNETDFTQPVVTVSLGLPAIFQWGGATRADRTCPVRLEHGDVMVWGGADRLNFHGVKELPAGDHPLIGPWRYSLTFRKAR
jgi:alkylated DNA repair protein (DNA oxidative demethylase)